MPIFTHASIPDTGYNGLFGRDATKLKHIAGAWTSAPTTWVPSLGNCFKVTITGKSGRTQEGWVPVPSKYVENLRVYTTRLTLLGGYSSYDHGESRWCNLAFETLLRSGSVRLLSHDDVCTVQFAGQSNRTTTQVIIIRW